MSNDIEQKVRQVVAAVLQLPNADAEITRADTPKWDSLKNLEVFFALEDAFGVVFEEDEFTRYTSTADLTTAVEQKLNAT